jgi:nitrite reductase (NO-forming)
MPATLTPPELEQFETVAPEAARAEREKSWREWMMVGLGLAALVAVMAIVVAVFALAGSSEDKGTPAAAPAAKADTAPAVAAAPAKTATIADAKGVAFEKFEWVDPSLPAVPAGPVKKFKVDVYHHVTQVNKELAPTEVWSYKVNGVEHRGTGVSEPMVVNEGDKVDFTLTNGSNKSMKVTLPHSLDFHSAEVNPGTRYADLAPGKSMHYQFIAKHPGVYMYHCATQPVLMHTGAGMVGMMIVKPKNLPAVDRELWINQQEFYIGKPGGQADMAKMNEKKPDVIAFNGYGNQYKDKPITVKRGEKIRMFVLNSGPSVWSAFHVIGTVFDKTVTDNGVAHDVQSINLAPSQGGYVEFTLDEEGTYPFVNHSFGDMVKGSLGVLATENPPKGAGHGH